MILVRKNVSKVLIFWKCFKFERCFESVGVCFENSKDVCFEMDQVTRSNLPTQKFFMFIFFLLWHCYLTIDLVDNSIFGCKGMGVGHRIVMIAMLWDTLAFLFEGLRSFWKASFDSVIEGLWYFIFYCSLLRHLTCIIWPFL